ncbi:hypothetical protein [Alicyclobacillus tolerans]|uniref:Uncharacterized protein n=1 Tax=Alicyclobacillus tolerans TaxID=90970 RepID=A0A1M6TPK2_9BACL|nr:hypothetical protein [Alicyclobacillus montanus]SHK58867.1 hypothetical protein SAMN05443507_11735 [Alicyclobacillus montanus]
MPQSTQMGHESIAEGSGVDSTLLASGGLKAQKTQRVDYWHQGTLIALDGLPVIKDKTVYQSTPSRWGERNWSTGTYSTAGMQVCKMTTTQVNLHQCRMLRDLVVCGELTAAVGNLRISCTAREPPSGAPC